MPKDCRRVCHGRHSRTRHSGLRDPAVWYLGGVRKLRCLTRRAEVWSQWNDDVCTPTKDVAVGYLPVGTWRTAQQQFSRWPSTERTNWTTVCSCWALWRPATVSSTTTWWRLFSETSANSLREAMCWPLPPSTAEGRRPIPAANLLRWVEQT